MGTPTALRKTRAVLTGTSFADNTTGAITAQMVRQFAESGMGGYATICAKAGTPASQSIATATTTTIDLERNKLAVYADINSKLLSNDLDRTKLAVYGV